MDDGEWGATGSVDGEPFVFRMPDGYDPHADQGRAVGDAIAAYLNERDGCVTE